MSLRRWISRAARLYPPEWRRRYSSEFDALLDDLQPRWKDLRDTLRGAFLMQLQTSATYLRLAGIAAAIGAVIAAGLAFGTSDSWVSAAVVRLPAQAQTDSAEMLGRMNLAEIMLRPDLDLYRAERSREPIEDVVRKMRDGIRYSSVARDSYSISFQYPDREKSRKVVEALVERSGLEVIDPPELAARPSWPNRPLMIAMGLGIGAVTGVLLVFLRPIFTRRNVLAGLAGAVLAGAFSFVTPERYVSSATLRVFGGPSATVPGDYLRDLSMRVFSRESLAEIVLKPAINLYANERQRHPMEDVVSEMRNKHIRASFPALIPNAGTFEVSFMHSDRFTAQTVARELVARFTQTNVTAQRDAGIPSGEWVTVKVVDPPFLPGKPVWPPRWLIVGAGMVAGMLCGWLIGKFRMPPHSTVPLTESV
jgi:hypothetical protein